MAWLSVGMLTVFFLFWLCKRTAATVSKEPGELIFSLQRDDLGADDPSRQIRVA